MNGTPQSAQSVKSADMRARFEAAKRGDLVVFEIHRNDWIQGEGTRERTTFEVGIVTGIDLAGHVKRHRTHYSSDPKGQATASTLGIRRRWLVSSAVIDVEAAARAAWSNEWPSGHAGMPFDSLEQVKEVLRPFKV